MSATLKQNTGKRRTKCKPGQHKLRVALSDDITMRLECASCDHVEYRPVVCSCR